MAVFVILALALAVLSVAAVVVAALQVVTVGRGLAAAVGEATTQLRPLAEELAEEAAVTAAELEALGARAGDR